MSLYQLDVVFPKENVSMSYSLEINDDERRESENDESGRNNESEFKDDSTFILMKNRIKIKHRRKEELSDMCVLI